MRDYVAFLDWLNAQGIELCRWEKVQEHPLVRKRHWELVRLEKQERDDLATRYYLEALTEGCIVDIMDMPTAEGTFIDAVIISPKIKPIYGRPQKRRLHVVGQDVT